MSCWLNIPNCDLNRYDPLNKFMLLKHCECSLPSPLNVFEMIITPELEFPMLCVSVKQSYQPGRYKLELINVNSGASWFHSDELADMDGTATVVPRRENLNIVSVQQLDKDAIVIAHDNVVRVVTQQGRLRDTKKQISDFRFDFKIESIGGYLRTPAVAGWLGPMYLYTLLEPYSLIEHY